MNAADTDFATQICICSRARRLAQSLSDFYADFLTEVGVNSNQLKLMMVIYKTTNPTICTLADWLGRDQTTITRNLKVLQNSGKITMAPGKEDKRFRQVSLTPDGMQIIKKALPLWQKAQAETIKKYGKDFIQQLITLTEDPALTTIF